MKIKVTLLIVIIIVLAGSTLLLAIRPKGDDSNFSQSFSGILLGKMASSCRYDCINVETQDFVSQIVMI